ncbi:MAG: glutamyl-tRNA reductase [Edaphobacter sp.]
MSAPKTTNAQGLLVLLGINHNTAPIEVRERLAIPSARLADATRTLLHQPGIREGLILSTCNRVELLTLQDEADGAADTHQTKADLLRFLHEYFAVSSTDIQPHLYEFREREAVRHLFRVACSLDSMVVGEPQILGQVKESYMIAREVGAVSTHLESLLQRTFTVAKKIRTETQIGSSSVSIASVGVDLARKIFGSLQGKTVLLVGAGKMSELAARHLIEHGATSILVVNRTQSRAEKIAADLGSLTVHTEAIPFDDLYAQAPRADIVITSTGAPEKIFSRSHGQQFLHARRNRHMFFIDIAVPRDVDPQMNEVEGCFVYDIDDLQQVAATNLADRSREAAAAETIVSREVDKYHERLQSRDAVPAIKALQQQAEELRQAELARSQSKLATLTPEQRDAVEALTRSLTAKLLHPQLTALRDSTRRRDEE